MDGIDEDMARIAGILRALPYATFSEAWFQILIGAHIPDADPGTAAAAPRS